jgi:hypothetical protein
LLEQIKEGRPHCWNRSNIKYKNGSVYSYYSNCCKNSANLILTTNDIMESIQ